MKVLVANKSDMPESEKKVSSARGKELADKHGLSFFETSAKSGHNVNETFQHIATSIITQLQK